MWMRVIPDLVTMHRIVAPDLPGHGTSQLVDGRLDADGLRAWLSGVIERTCPSPPVLVGHVLGGAIGARFAVNHSDRLSRLVLVDSLGLARFRPTPTLALTMLAFLARPTERTYTRFMRQCSFDLDGLRHELGQRWEPFLAYSLERARGPNAKIAGRLLREFGIPRIPPDDLARIAVPTTLIWGRHDRANRLRIAQAASERYRWPLHVIELCGRPSPVTSRSRSWRHSAWHWAPRGSRSRPPLDFDFRGGCRESSHPRIRIHCRNLRLSGSCNGSGPGAIADHRHAPARGPSTV
jgi:pimeloyl-ACP methyl ester carboxylesterase